MQKQQVGYRVHSGRARPLVRVVQRGEGKSQVQARSSMGAASRLGGIAEFPYTIKRRQQAFRKYRHSLSVCINLIPQSAMFIAARYCMGPVFMKSSNCMGPKFTKN